MSTGLMDAVGRQQGSKVARLVWLVLFALEVGVFVAGISVWAPLLGQVCKDSAELCRQRQLYTQEEVRALTGMGWSLEGYARFILMNQIAQKLVGVMIGLLIFVRRPSDRMAWIASAFLVIGIETSVAEALIAAQVAWTLPARLLSWVGIICNGLFFYLFPTGRFVPGWIRWVMIVYGLLFFLSIFFTGTPVDLNEWGFATLFIGMIFFGSFLGAQMYRYRNLSNEAERQQTKWVVLAAVIGCLALLGSLVTVRLYAGPTQRISQYPILVNLGFSALSYAIPIALGIAILRHRLFDIDIIIRRTLVYSTLSALLALFYLGSVVLLQGLSRQLTGEAQSPLATVLSTLVIAGLFTPLRGRVQAFIDRRFFRSRYDAQQILVRFGASLRDGTNADLDALTGELLGVIQETMQPARLSLWLPGAAQTSRNEVETRE